MDSRLYASNISDSLFNTTLVVTTILVSGVPPGPPSCRSPGGLLPLQAPTASPGTEDGHSHHCTEANL